MSWNGKDNYTHEERHNMTPNGSVSNINRIHNRAKKPSNSKLTQFNGVFKNKQQGRYDVYGSRERDKLIDFGKGRPTTGYIYYGTFDTMEMAIFISNLHFAAQGNVELVNNTFEDPDNLEVQKWMARNMDNKKLWHRALVELEAYEQEKNLDNKNIIDEAIQSGEITLLSESELDNLINHAHTHDESEEDYYEDEDYTELLDALSTKETHLIDTVDNDLELEAYLKALQEDNDNNTTNNEGEDYE